MVIRKLLVLFLVLFIASVLFLTVPVSAFEDSVQRYPTGQLNDTWTITTSGTASSATIVNNPTTYPTSYSIKLKARTYNAACYVLIENNEVVDTSYLAFTLRPSTYSTHAAGNGKFHIRYYNTTDGVLTDTAIIQGYSPDIILLNDQNSFYEIVKSGSNFLLYINGEYIDNIGTSTLDNAYIGIYQFIPDMNDWGEISTYIDDITTSSIIGMNEQWTQSDAYIDLSYGIQSMASYPESEFSIRVKKKNTGFLINKTIITDPAGFVRWNRSDIFSGNYGDFRVYYYKDSSIYAYTDFTITDTTSPIDAITSDAVCWDQDLYYTGETAYITTQIKDIDTFSYSYYLDLYNTDDYLTTFEITGSEVVFEYTFPTEWADTSLLAKLQRVANPYATNEVQLAYDISHFETLDWDTTVSFNKSSYNPSDTLKVTWSGAADGSDVWLRAGDDGEVIEYDVAYSGSFTFNVPANTTETYYIVDVATGGYSQAQASCEISSVPDFFFNYSVDVDQDEYYHGDWVTVTYSTDTPAVIKVFDDTNADIWHYLDVPAAVTNETWIYYIGDTDPFGSYSVLFGNNDFLVSDYYSVVSSTSFVQVVPESMYMYETMKIWYITNGSSTLSIKDSSDSILFNQTVNSSSLESISYIPTVSGILSITLSDVPADATDSIIVYWAEDPDDLPDEDDIDDDVIEDILDPDESMTEYYNEKFRDFAPTIWGFFMLMCLLFLMSILTSFNSGGKR